MSHRNYAPQPGPQSELLSHGWSSYWDDTYTPIDSQNIFRDTTLVLKMYGTQSETRTLSRLSSSSSLSWSFSSGCFISSSFSSHFMILLHFMICQQCSTLCTGWETDWTITCCYCFHLFYLHSILKHQQERYELIVVWLLCVPDWLIYGTEKKGYNLWQKMCC